MTVSRCLLTIGVGAALAVGCSSAATVDETSGADQTEALSRDFSGHPAILEVETADQVYAVSDVHGQYDIFVRLLEANHLIARAESDPTRVRWTGGTATLVIAGDHIDKGPKSVAVIDLLRTLEEQAPRVGGRSIALMGNHEAEFLDNPRNTKAMSTGTDEQGIGPQLDAIGVDPRRMAAGTDAEGRGAWLANLPLGVRVKKWFFAHGGNTQRKSINELNKLLAKSLANKGFGDDDVTGKDSILEGQHWYGNPKDGDAGKKEVEALGGVEHIVFGHDPGAFDSRGKPRQSKNGLLVKIDGAMGLHDKHSPNPAFMLHISTKGADRAEVLDEKGDASPLE